eukprot:883253-Rhodomonas_salina.3
MCVSDLHVSPQKNDEQRRDNEATRNPRDQTDETRHPKHDKKNAAQHLRLPCACVFDSLAGLSRRDQPGRGPHQYERILDVAPFGPLLPTWVALALPTWVALPAWVTVPTWVRAPTWARGGGRGRGDVRPRGEKLS